MQLCIEPFGDPDHPPLLLIAGAACSMDWWEDALVERIAAAGRFVVRYDARDTGMSDHFPAGDPPYDLTDLVADAVAVLDVLGIDSAHVVGLSMGGTIAQLLGLDHANRVRTLTLVATTPGTDGGAGESDLPAMDPSVAAGFEDPSPDPDWSDRDAVIETHLDGERRLAGSIPFDENRIREIAGRVFDRTADIEASMTNHFLLDGPPTRQRLGGMQLPTLVLHGTRDPLFPYGHAEALAAEIPGAVLVPLDGMGHQYPPPELWDRFVAEVVRHTEASR